MKSIPLSTRRHLAQTGQRRRLIAGSSAAMIVVALLALAPADAVLPNSPSNFESNDGDMVGTADWAGVKNDARYFYSSDPTNGTDNSFEPGSKQDEACPDVAPHSNPPKDDFTDVASFAEVGGSGAVFLYGATLRVAPNGNASENIELKQGLNGSCPGSPLLARSAGDKMIAIDYLNGGTSVQFNVLTWVTSGACYIASHIAPCFGATVQTLTANGAEGKVNQADITAANNSISGKAIKAGQFAEFGVNLQTAGIIPAGTCKAFPQTIWESRASGSSFVSSTKDIIIENKVISNCGKITIKKVTENGDDSFGYTTTGSGLSSFNLSNGGKKEFLDVQTGAYSVTEVITAGQIADGWSLKSVSCTANGSGTSATPAGAVVAITMGTGGDVECTYTNFKKFSPTIATKLNGESGILSVQVGSSVYDTATLTGASSNAGGTVTYTVYSDSACSQNARDAGTKTVTNGSVPQSDSLPFNTAGTFYWQAAYSGDVNNNPATSACEDEVLSITKRAPGASTAQNLKPNDSFTLTGGFNATGNVVFKLYPPSNPTCSGAAAFSETVALSGGTSASTTNTSFIASAEGTWRWLVTYAGDGNNDPVTSNCGVEAFTIDNDTGS
jgi:hypothetical protein